MECLCVHSYLHPKSNAINLRYGFTQFVSFHYALLCYPSSPLAHPLHFSTLSVPLHFHLLPHVLPTLFDARLASMVLIPIIVFHTSLFYTLFEFLRTALLFCLLFFVLYFQRNSFWFNFPFALRNKMMKYTCALMVSCWLQLLLILSYFPVWS